MSNYQIRPLNTGTIILDKGYYVTAGIGLGQEIEVPAIAWYLTDGQHQVLVDTGIAATELADWHHAGSKQAAGQAVHELLEALGVRPEKIEMVFFTHLHWDHCHNMDKFANARLVVGATELAFALEPIPPYFKSYEYRALGMKAPFIGQRLEVIDGETELLPGLTAFPTPGHSIGHMSLAVDTSNGVHVIAGDAAFSYDNLTPAAAHLPFTMIGRYVNGIAAWQSLEAIVRRGDVVLPGHEPRVLDAELYPTSSPSVGRGR